MGNDLHAATTLPTALVRPSKASSAVKFAASWDSQVINIPELDPMWILMGRFIRRGIYISPNQKLNGALTRSFKWDYADIVFSSFWDNDKIISFPITRFFPCIQKSLIIKETKSNNIISTT